MVNVYDLSPGVNDWLWPVGLGVFHSGVSIHGKEWTFSSGGVFHSEPKFAPGAVFRESICVGEVLMGSHEVEAVVNDLRAAFPGDTYNVVQKNCNSFSAALTAALLKKHVMPGHVNRLAYFGSCFSCLFPKEGDGGVQMAARPAFNAFGGQGNSMGGGGGGGAGGGGGGGDGGGGAGAAGGAGSGDRDSARERRAAAALARFQGGEKDHNA